MLMYRFSRGGVQQDDLGSGSGAAIVSLGTLLFEKTAIFKDTVDVSCYPTYGQCQYIYIYVYTYVLSTAGA